MRRRARHSNSGLALCVVLTAVLSAPALGQEASKDQWLEKQKEALDLIDSFATKVCIADIPLSGSGVSLELSGTAKAELSKLLRQLTTVGIEGSASWEQEKYEGLLREDLAEVLGDARACKERVSASLLKEMLPELGAIPTPAQPNYPPSKVVLRTKPGTFTRDQIEAVVQARGFYATYIGKNHAGFPNEFRDLNVGGVPVVVDHATGLMWPRSASPRQMSWYAAPEYVAQLNASRFAGFSDWRVPTLEELLSLMEPQVNGAGLFMDSRFSVSRGSCWSADRKEYPTNADTAWSADFDYGGVIHGGYARNRFSVLPVRSVVRR